MRPSAPTSAALAVVALLVLLPAAEALEVGTRSVRARASTEYSPETAWDVGHYGCGVTIAVFDEGVDDRHPHLDGKVVAGYDATDTREAWLRANGGNPQPLVGSHGTPVAGLALSHAGKAFFSRDAFPGYAEDDRVGVAPCAWMVDVQFSDLGADSEGLQANIVEAFAWAVEHRDFDWGDDDPSNDGIDVITMSWSPNDGTDGTDPVSEAANAAVRAGIVVLGSMGNSGATEYRDWGTPAAADLSIGVGNLWNQRTVTRDDDVIRDSSTRGPRPDDGDGDPYEEMKPDVSTPGHGVVGPVSGPGDGSEYAVAGCGDESTLGDLPLNVFSCHAGFSGTSAATPMTAGVVALMLDANPALLPADVKEILHQSAVPHPDQTPSLPGLNAKYNWTYGFGMTDAHDAVRLALSWPGLELGRDRDSDGLRDAVDAAPTDPRLAQVRVPEGLLPAGGAADSDGDGVPDDADPAPLVPLGFTVEPVEDAVEDAPGVGLAAGLVVLALLAARRRG